MLTLAYKGPNGFIENLVIDATISETHSAEVVVTEHPVETGADVTDHVRPKPKTYKLEGLLVDFPLPAAGAQGTNTANAQAGPGRAVYLYDRLEQLCLQGTPIDVLSGVKIYSDMVFESLSIPSRDKATGAGALKFTGTLKEIRFVSSQTVPITKLPAAKPQAKIGKQTGTPAEEHLRRQSIAYSAVEKFAPQFLK